MTEGGIQIALAIATVLVSGVGSYYAALTGVKISLAKIGTEIEWLKASRTERDRQQDERYSNMEDRIRALESGRHRYPTHGD